VAYFVHTVCNKVLERLDVSVVCHGRDALRAVEAVMDPVETPCATVAVVARSPFKMEATMTVSGKAAHDPQLITVWCPGW
jgi:hypothetical protein